MLPDLDRPEPDHHVVGVVGSIDGPLAGVLLGPAQEPWEFPLDMLPAGARAGSCVRVGMAGTRPVEITLDEDAQLIQPRAVEDRLDRLARLERLGGVATDPATAPSPASAPVGEVIDEVIDEVSGEVIDDQRSSNRAFSITSESAGCGHIWPVATSSAV
jgi:hypothetical protein